MALFHVPGVGIQQVHPDLMHTKHLGVDQYYFGSVLKFLTHHLLPGSPAENLEVIWVHIQEGYSGERSSSRFGSLRLTMFDRPGEFPRLKGKAGELRHFGRPLLFAFDRLMDAGNQLHRQIRLGLLYSIEIENILDEHADDFRLPPVAATWLNTRIANLLTIQTSLARRLQDAGELMFHTTIKSHYLVHIGLNAAQLNPRMSWCYSGEDLMQKAKLLIQGSQSNNPPQRVVPKVMLKYVMALAYTMFSNIWR
jgi:hypothetical protein